MRGLIREHQFEKVELVKITHPNVIRRARGADAERGRGAEAARPAVSTVALCTGDLGFAMAKTYDVEVWLPGQNAYKEITSCSTSETFQARRGQYKFKIGGTGKPEFVHT